MFSKQFTKLADQDRHTDEVDMETLEIVVDKGLSNFKLN